MDDFFLALPFDSLDFFLLLLVILPVTLSAIRLPAFIAERRAMARTALRVGRAEIIVPARRKAKATKASLLRITSEATIDSARRCLASARYFAKADAISARVNALVEADIRRNLRKARQTFRKSAAAVAPAASRRSTVGERLAA